MKDQREFGESEKILIKTGDRVKVSEDCNCGYIYKGKEGVVSKVLTSISLPSECEIKLDGCDWVWHAKTGCLKIIEEEK